MVLCHFVGQEPSRAFGIRLEIFDKIGILIKSLDAFTLFFSYLFLMLLAGFLSLKIVNDAPLWYNYFILGLIFRPILADERAR